MFSRMAVRVLAICLVMSAVPASAQQWQFPAGEQPVADPVDVVFTVDPGEAEEEAGRAQIALCMQDDENYYYADLGPDGVALGRCIEGKRSALTAPTALPPGAGRMAIQRRARLLRLVCDGRPLLTCYDDALHDGKTAVTSEGGPLIEGLTPQPIAPITMDDDFGRTPDGVGMWETISGEWESSGAVEERPEPQLSANPFSFHVRADARAIAVAGYDFWDSYRFSAAIKPVAEGAVGLAACVQDPDNCYLLRWSRSTAAGASPDGRLQLIVIDDGNWRLLAERVDMPYHVETWHRLEIAVADGCVEALVDDRPLLAATDDTFVRGKVALYAEACPDAYFDDAQVRSWDRYRESFATNPLPHRRCLPVTGAWTVEHEHLYGVAADRNARAIAVTGRPDWENYTLEAAVKLRQAQRVGLILGYQDPDNYYLARWGTTAQGQGTRELIRVVNGDPEPLATATFTCIRDRFEQIRLRWHRGHITLEADGHLALQASDATFAGGPVGFYVEGDASGCFDNVGVAFHRSPPPPPPVAEQFTQEDTMTNWASAEACWDSPGEDLYLFDLPLFGDYRLDVQLKPLKEEDGELTLFLGADEKLEGGVRLKAQCAGGMLTTQLLLGERILDSGSGASGAPAPMLVVERDGDAVSASLVEDLKQTTLLAHQVGHALTGRRIGFQRDGLSAGPGEIHVRSDAILDQTFSGAATDWRGGGGVWSVHDRWPCYPGWSWFGGVDPAGEPKNPIVWSKDEWLGDLVLECWTALIMDLPKEPGYSDPSDLNVTICANGRDLCSGYSFIFAGDHNTHAKIMRGNEVVATNDKGVFVNPKSNNAAFHRHWFETRIVKRGGHIEYYVDGQFMGEYDDPEPLSSGGIALWSYNNGMNIARVRISAESRLRAALADPR